MNQTAVVAELRERGYDVDVVERPYDIVVSGDKQVWFTSRIGMREYNICTCSVRVELKSEKGKLSDSQVKYIENLKYPDSYIVARSPADDPMPAVREIEKWFGN